MKTGNINQKNNASFLTKGIQQNEMKNEIENILYPFFDYAIVKFFSSFHSQSIEWE